MNNKTCLVWKRYKRLPSLFIFLVIRTMTTLANHLLISPLVNPTPSTLNTRYTVPGTYTFTVPEGVTSLTVDTWGGGGRGGSRTSSSNGTGGGGGGAYSRHTFSVVPGQSYVVNVGAGSVSNSSSGDDSWVSIDDISNAIVLAKGGNSAATNSTSGASGGSASSGIGSVRYSGGDGADRVSSTSSGGGGSSAGTSANGNNASGVNAGSAPSGGGNGGQGRTNTGSGNAGLYPGGGGGGAVRGSSGSPSGGAGGHGQILITYTFTVDAGVDQTQCNNALFFVNTITPPSGYTATWSVVSGIGYIYDNSTLSTTIIIPRNSTTTVRLTVTNGSTTVSDDVILTNNNSCTPTCVNPINANGDLELPGNISVYSQSFQGTPASLIYQNNNPINWSEAYGSNSPNTSSFTGAYYLNKTGSNGNPKSGSKFIYMAGNGFCLSSLKTGNNLQCGKTYRVSVWVAAYTNGSPQTTSPFFLEFFAGGTNLPTISMAHQAIAPTSSSWNSLNWQRYSFDFTVPAAGYEWSDFVFTTSSNTNGIVIDDMCIQEIFSGSIAQAGSDIFNCSNDFTMGANTPSSGYGGMWSVVSGNASIATPSSPTSNVTLSSGTAARLRWTVSATGSLTSYTALDPKGEGGFENCCSASDNGWSTSNHSTNQWHIGSVSNPSSGNRAAYISNNSGTSYAYTNTTSQTSHLYRNVQVHPGATNINLSFKWKANGQSGYDRLLVYTAPTSVTPSSGSPSSSSTSLSGATLVGSVNLHSTMNYVNENILLSNGLEGTTFRLIFTWQNNNSSGSNPPASIDEVSVTYDLPSCASTDEVNIAYASSGSFEVLDEFICAGETAYLTANGCNPGTLSWSNGSDQSSIIVSPLETTSYSVTCTPGGSSNLLQNAGYESSTNMQYWENWANASITTTGSNVYAGSKAVMVNTIGQSWGGVAQSITTSAGTKFRVRVYAKTTNTNILPSIRYEFYQGGTVIEQGLGALVTSNSYQLYEFEMVSPPNTTSLYVIAELGAGGQLFVDNWELINFSSCVESTTATVHVGETNSLKNNEFDNGSNFWNLYVQGGNSASLTIDNTSQISGTNSARVNISSASGTNWHIQLLQQNVALQAGKTYAISFKAKAVSNRTINAFVDLGESPYTTYFNQDVSLTTSTQTFTYTFLQPVTIPNGRVGFNLGQSSQNVWIDNVEFFEVCQSFEICDNGIDDDGDGLIDGLDNDCTVQCDPQDYVFANPVLISGTNREVGSVYRFSNIIAGVDARVTYVSRSHNDIELISLDEPEATNGGYEWAFQPIIDYNWLNPGGSMESSNSDKYITFKFEFLSAGTNNLYTLPTFNMSAIDVDGNGVDIREFFETTGFHNYKVETPTTLTISNALRALGSLPAFDGVDETALTSMITFLYINTHTVIANYGGKYIAGSSHNDNSEKRLNCLFFKCYEYNTIITCPSLSLAGTPNVCEGGSAGVFANINFHATKLKPVNSYLCLDPGGNNNNAVITQSNCNNTAYENWQIELVSGYSDRYFIKNSGSNLYIRPLNGGTSNGTNVTQANGNDASFHWELVYHSVGRYHIKHVQSGKYLDVSGGNISSGTPMIIYSFHGGTNQQFYIDGGAIPHPSNEFNYLWSNGATSQSLLEVPTVTTTYTVSVTSNTNNCELVRDFTVEVSSASASISGTNVICSGASSIFTATGGDSYLWSTGATSAAINVNTANTYTVTVTDELGCTATSSRTLTVYTNPTSPVIGTITQPTCTTSTGSVILSGLPSSGSWTITRSPGGTTYTGSGTSYTVTGLPVSTTYTFTVTNASFCTSTASANVVINAVPTIPTLGGASAVCVGLTANVTPSTAGTWLSSNSSVATITNVGLVSGLAAGSVTLTYTRTADGCVNTKPFTVHESATVPVVGSITQPNCNTPSGSVILSGLPSSGSWTITRNPGGTTYTGSGTSYTVTSLPVNATYTFVVTNANNCTSASSANVAIQNMPTSPSVSIDYLGTVCITDNKQIAASVTGGTGPFMYNWTGPSGFTSTLGTIDITLNGNYYITVTDANFCTATSSGFVYTRYEPLIVTLNSTICEGTSISLDVTSATAISYQWDANANNATTKMVTVTPGVPSTLYRVTVTNDLGCVSVPEILINVNPKPTISVSGPNEICVGQTTNVLPSSGGSWASTDPSVAQITNTGLVTGLSEGTSTFIFTESVHNCSSDASTSIVVKPKPIVSVSGPATICIGDTTTVLPNSGGTWASANNSVATINNNGVITAIEEGTTTFIFTNDLTECASDATQAVTVQSLPSVSISGVDGMCLGSNQTFTANFPGGTWSISDTLIAEINNSGILTSIDTGEVTIYYHFTSGVCHGLSSKTINIYEIPAGQFAGPNEICVGQTTNMTPGEGGVWTSSNPDIASINDQGLVTGLQSGYAAFTFVHSETGCISETSSTLTVFAKPSISLNGPSGLCLGGSTNFLPFSGGVWSSSNPFVASITNGGAVTANGAGSSTFTFTHDETGCVSDTSVVINVGTTPSASLDFHGSVCLTDTSKISVIATGGTPEYFYNWVGPLGFSASTDLVNITNNGTYYVTVTDSYGCKANVSGYVNQQFDPIIVNLNTTVCVGQSATLSVNASSPVSYLWSENAGSATSSSVVVVPTLPSSTYFVTVTNTLGCNAVTNATIFVNPKPTAQITGSTAICVGQTTNLTPSSGGTWISVNPSIASISQAGLVTGFSGGTARFIFTQSSNGCKSDTSGYVTVNPRTTISLGGPSSICIGSQTQLVPSSGGTWTALHPSIASVSTSGLVTGQSQGSAQFTFTNSLGCLSSGSLTVTVNNKPGIVLDGPSNLCAGSTTIFLPSSGGTWTSSHPLVATITNGGIVTAVSSGSARFVFTNNSSGCKSDSSAIITVVERPTVSLTGPASICVGLTTIVSPSTGGTWVSNNPSIASVNNSGLVVGISAGTTSFVFTNSSTGCTSSPTSSITVFARPVAVLSGPNGICIGATTTLTPTSGGTWTSSNPSIATITNGGVVTALTAGLVNFSFTNTTSGCSSLPSGNVTVFPRPTVSTSSSGICIGASTTIQPAVGGTWVSLQPSIASVNNSGVVLGLMQGSTQFVFTDSNTGCVSNPTASVSVSPKPITSITGQPEICQASTSQLSPTSGGNWVSTNPSVATVNSTGLVTGLSSGTVQFIFTSTQGCAADPTDLIIINSKPFISLPGSSSICVGTTTQLNPSTVGTWVSSKPSVASVTSGGLVTGLTSGTARFVYTNTTTGCVSDSSSLVTINPAPSVGRLGADQICIGQTSQLFPTAGGTWLSLTPSIATISNGGLVTGIGAGTGNFTFTQSSSGCQSTLNGSVTILPRPSTNLNGPPSICIGGTTQFTPNSGGTWATTNPSVASIDNAGIVTGLAQGIATFVFTSATNGCTSLPSTSITVQAKPSIALNGSSIICIGGNTQFLPNNGGTWASGNPAIATINDLGVVTGVSQGATSFIFTSSTTGCTSNPTVSVNVNPPATLNVSGPSQICMGYNSTLSASTTGVWFSTRADIAKTTSNGLVTGVAPGKVSFYFVDATSGCTTHLPADIITVANCIDPDFNVTMVNVTLTGNVKTNDEVPAGTTYQPTIFLLSKPLGSVANITLNSIGEYTFTANTVGTYIYETMICLPSMGGNCPVSRLVIHVINPNSETHNIITNLDIIYTYENQSVTIFSTENDRCISGLSCEIDPNLMSIVVNPKGGVANILPSGNIAYTPNLNFVGLDTIRYQICASNNPSNCKSAAQIVTVMANSASRALAAADDFFFISKGQSLSGVNVKTNDKDVFGDLTTITALGDASNPISISSGSYYITSEGDLFFTPSPTFSGPVDIPYTICSPGNYCVMATAHILVLENLKMRIRAYLEGALMENSNQRGSDNRPLMRDDLRMSPYTGTNYIPTTDPYSLPQTYFDLSGIYTHLGASAETLYTSIPNPTTVFSVLGQNAIVDWVFIELRSRLDSTLILGTRSALIQRDGDVVDLDGTSPVEFPGVRADSCFVVLKHRNHFGVMSKMVATQNLLDFTLATTPTFDFGTSKGNGYDYTGLSLKTDELLGVRVLWAGDFDSNGRIKFVNPEDDQNILFFEVLSFPANQDFMGNYNFSYGYLQGDFNMNSKSKYDNPDDDKNMLFYQVLFHPLNGSYISNFNNIIQQIPEAR
ncbi:MAG: Ig-like domain-containing protein [Saprospiraceae bacterium]